VSLKVCVGPYLSSTVQGLDLARHWFPRIVKEAFLVSSKDGEIARSPDPVTLIDGDLSWFNATDDPQHVIVQLLRAPRSVVVQNPATVVIHDAVSWAVGQIPVADFPSVMQDAFGGRAQVDRPEVASDKLQFGRLFLEGESTQADFTVGVVPAGESLHFRYVCSVQTPGTWTTPSEFEPRWEASAYWVRLKAYATPAVTV